MADSVTRLVQQSGEAVHDPMGSTAIGHRSRRRYLRYMLISALIGVGIGILTGIGRADIFHPVRLLIGAWVGLCVGGGATVFEWILFRIYEPRTRWQVQCWSVLGFSVGGALGYFLAGQVLVVVFDVQVDEASGRAALIAALFFGLFAALVGFILQTIEILRSRLAQSVAQLKEAEFAAKELVTAREIQQRLLPPAVHATDCYRLSAANRPATVVAGDFYDYFERGDGSLLFAVGDVAGKGLGASLIMATVKARLPLVLADADLEHAVHDLNEQLCRDLGSREFVALAILRLHPGDGELEWVSAGLPTPLLVRNDGDGSVQLEELQTEGARLPLGMSQAGGYRAGRRRLEVGDRVVVYSDGLPESLDAKGEPRGYSWWFDRVRSTLEADGDQAPDDLAGRLASYATVATADEDASAPDDDCTVLLLERLNGRGQGAT